MPQGEKQGPHPYAKMVKWARKGWFARDDFPVQHADLKCWVPLWFLLHMDDMLSGSAAGGGGAAGGWAGRMGGWQALASGLKLHCAREDAAGPPEGSGPF